MKENLKKWKIPNTKYLNVLVIVKKKVATHQAIFTILVKKQNNAPSTKKKK